MINLQINISIMVYLNRLTDDNVPIPIIPPCKPDRIGKDMKGTELHEFGLFMFIGYFQGQGGKLIAINMNPENGAPNVIFEDPNNVLLYVWVKTDLAPNIPAFVRNDKHDKIIQLSKQNRAVPSFASITIRCASPEANSIPKCDGEYYVVLNEFKEIDNNI
jgi:hypothetical protein